MIFASKFRLDDKHYPLPEFPQLTEHKLCDISWQLGRFLNLSKVYTKSTGPGKNTVVLKNFEPEVSLILAKLFHCCLKKKCFASPWNMSSVCSVCNNAGQSFTSSQYRLISLFSFIRKLFEAIIWTSTKTHEQQNSFALLRPLLIPPCPKEC